MPFHPVGVEEARSLAVRAMRERKRLQHGDVNVAKFVQMRTDPLLKKYTAESDLICIDGMGIVLGCRLLGLPTRGRVTGIDFMCEAIAACEREGFRPYFFGAKQDVLEAMVARLQKKHPALEIAGYRNGYFKPNEEPEIVQSIRDAKPDCLFVGISSPIKERFLFKYRDDLFVPLQMGVGGSFDVLSGKVRRAPRVMQKLGMEWLFRLLQEPVRLTGRYVSTNAAFASVLVRHIVTNRWRRYSHKKELS